MTVFFHLHGALAHPAEEEVAGTGAQYHRQQQPCVERHRDQHQCIRDEHLHHMQRRLGRMRAIEQLRAQRSRRRPGGRGQIGGTSAHSERLVRVHFLAPELDALVQHGQQEDAQRREDDGLQRFDVPPGEDDALAVAAVELKRQWIALLGQENQCVHAGVLCVLVCV